MDYYQIKYRHLRECMLIVANGLKETRSHRDLGESMLDSIKKIDKM